MLCPFGGSSEVPSEVFAIGVELKTYAISRRAAITEFGRETVTRLAPAAQ